MFSKNDGYLTVIFTKIVVIFSEIVVIFTKIVDIYAMVMEAFMSLCRSGNRWSGKR